MIIQGVSRSKIPTFFLIFGFKKGNTLNIILYFERDLQRKLELKTTKNIELTVKKEINRTITTIH